MIAIAITIPIRTVSALNAREHWAVRAKRVKRERHAVHLLWPKRRPELATRATMRLLTVRLTRLSPRGRLDDDNLRGALKAIRDQVAAELGVDDGDTTRARWEYGQGRGPWGVRVEILEGT